MSDGNDSLTGVEELPRAVPRGVDLATAVRRLYEWQYAHQRSNFTSLLYDLMSKADQTNFFRLLQAFPEEGGAFMLWRQAKTEIEFFGQFGIEIDIQRKQVSNEEG